MNSNQIQQDSPQINSSNQEEEKVNSQQTVSQGEIVNPDIQSTQTIKNIQSTTNESKQPQEQYSNTDEETEETPQSPLKFSDFLQKKERHKQVIKIIQDGKEAQNIKKHLNILNAYLRSINVAQVNKKISELISKSEASLLNSEIFESLKNQNIQFVDDRDKFEPLNDGQIIAIQLYHYCVFDLENKGKAQNIINLNNPASIKWIEPLIEVKLVNKHFIRLQNLEHEQKFKELCGEEQLEQYTNLKIGIFDLLSSILDLSQEKNQNDTQFESQDEEAQIYVDEIISQLISIENKEFYQFLNRAIYNAVDELQISSYFHSKLEKPIENVEKDELELPKKNLEKDKVEKLSEKLEKDVLKKPIDNKGQDGVEQSNFSENPVEISDINSVTGSLKLPLNEQEQGKVDEDIRDFLKNENVTEEKFVAYLLKTYEKLQDIQPQVISYLQNFKVASSVSSDTINAKDKLVKINDFNFKEKIIQWLKRNEKQLPSNFQCQEDYGLNQDQLRDFQKCFQQWKAISFEDNDVLPQEIAQLFKIFKEEINFQKISDQTLIEINLIKKFFVQWTSQLKQETELLEIMVYYGGGAESSVYVELILNDNQDEILKILLLIYKKNKKDYQKVTDILRKYTQKFENYELEKFLRLAKEKDLTSNSLKQKQVEELLDYFLKNDIIIYLMILHELWIEEEQQQQQSYLEEIILQEKHLYIIPAVAQLLILDQNPQLKAEVAEKRLFIDLKNEQVVIEKQLKEQLQVIIKHEESKEKLVSDEEVALNSESDNVKLVDTIKRLANITNKKIKIHLMSELKHCMVYNPDKEMDQSTLLLVQDESNQVFHVMIQHLNVKKQIDFRQLQDLKNKLPFLSNHFPLWLDTFVQLPSLRRVLLAEQQEKTPEEDQIVQKLLETISQTQIKFLQQKDTNSKKKLQKVVNQLWSLDFQLLQEWFHLQQNDDRMNDFCSYMITSSARQNSFWAFNQVSSLQKYFPMNPLKMTLKDFNRVQTRSE